MDKQSEEAKQRRLVEILNRRLDGHADCQEIVDAYGAVLRAAWAFMVQLVGEAGASAVLVRSLRQARRAASLLDKVRVADKGADLGQLREQVAIAGCGAPAVLTALIQLGLAIFQTLDALAGQALTDPLVRRLEDNEV